MIFLDANEQAPMPAYGDTRATPNVSARAQRRVARRALTPPLALSVLALAHACDVPVVRNCSDDAAVRCPGLDDPAGRIEGTLVYQGPPPLESPTRPGVASGRVVLLLFEYDNPPPPQGSAQTAVSFQTLAAAQVFAGATALPDGTVRATIPFVFPGIARAGLYQLRAFYSRAERIANPNDGSQSVSSGFHPLYGVRSLPVRGDVIGGALVDPNAAAPVFAPIAIGTPSGTDAAGRTQYALGLEGFVARNVTVFLGRPVPTERPQFSVVLQTQTVTGPMGPVTLPVPTPTERARPTQVPALDAPLQNSAGATLPPIERDEQGVARPSPSLLEFARQWGLAPAGAPVLDLPRNLSIQDTAGGTDLPRVTLVPGLAPTECATAALAGVACARDPFREIGFFELAADVNGNGAIDLTAPTRFADAHPTLFTSSPAASETQGRLPWLYPLVLVTKLHEPNAAERTLLTEGQNGRLTPEQFLRVQQSLNRPESLDLSDASDPRYPVVLFGSVLPGGTAAGFLVHPWSRAGFALAEPFPRVMLVPLGVEVRGPSRTTDWLPIVSPAPVETAVALERALQSQGVREVRCAPFDPSAGPDQATGLPAGRYAITLVSASGQSWSLPNDLGSFALAEGLTPPPAGCAGARCSAPSQSFFLRLRGLETPPPGARCPSLGR